MKKKLLSIGQVAVSVLLIYLTFSKIDLNDLKLIFNKIDFSLLLLSVITFAISQIIASERLRYILNNYQLRISFVQNIKVYMVGLFYNFFIPGGIGGDAYKAYAFNKIYKWNLKDVIKALVIDRLTGLSVLVCFLILLDNLFLNSYYFLKVPIIISVFFISQLFIKIIFKDKKNFSISFFISIFIQLFQFICLLFILKSINIDQNIIFVIFIFIVSSILSVFSFGGIGIREYVFMSSSSILALSPEQSASIGLIFTIVSGICSLPGLLYVSRLK
jgi:glycosyltransferase 2 family protein